ncbi:MAG: SpoIID/LytB domain-containing protein [Desulfotomaculaceae bacterium]|nr:SpoIID/LytB domain-containing protein [Desulfotomaculaceae bacterium]
MIKILMILLLSTMILLPGLVANAAVVGPENIRVVLARQSTPVNLKVSNDYQLVNQASGKFAAWIKKNEDWQVRLENGQIQLQGPDESYGPFNGPVAVVQGNDFRVNIIAGNKKVVESAAGGLTAINAGGKAVPLAESTVLSARSWQGIQRLEANSGLSLVSIQIGPEYRRYRGNIEFSIEKENLIVINELNIEDYLRGVVPAEMPSSWPSEALKAQAVVARNYALQKVDTTRGSSFNLTSDQQSQVYRGYDAEAEATDRAVADTRGLVLLNQGKIIPAFFHSSSGGFIENSEDVWLNRLPYIKAKEDPFDKNNRHYNWQVSYTNEQLTKMVKTEQYPFVQITDIEVVERTATGARAKKLVVEGIGVDGKPVTREIFNADNVRSALGLKSSLFNIKKVYAEKDDLTTIENDRTADKDDRAKVEDDRNEEKNNSDNRKYNRNETVANPGGAGRELAEIEITGNGYGHGVGLAQWGAYAMAKQGYNFQEILQYYYTDVSLTGNYGRQ